MGKGFGVKWNTTQIKGVEEGLVIAYEGKGRFWVKYDYLKDADGSDTFPEGLLASKAPVWHFTDSSTPQEL